MRHDSFRFHFKRLKDYFGAAQFPYGKESAIWAELKDLPDQSILRIVNEMLLRPVNMPPSVDAFKAMAQSERTGQFVSAVQSKGGEFKPPPTGKEKALEDPAVRALYNAIMKKPEEGA